VAVGGGAAVRYRDIPTEPAPEWIYLVDAFQDMVYSINHRLSITQDLSMLGQPFGAEDEFLLKLNAALTNKLTEQLDLKLRYEYEYDRSLDDAARKNQRIVTSVAYIF
jgi:putative salt-induced outer membrane protein YdiY